MVAGTRFSSTIQPLPHAQRPAVLQQLAEHCRFNLFDGRSARYQSTGFAALDERLPGGGWPVGALSEVMPARPGIGELSLLMPALAQLARAGRQLACIAPPWVPYPPALAQRDIDLAQWLMIRPRDECDALWAMEQCLRCTAFGGVMAWCNGVDERELRRLQLAAEAGGTIAWLYRPMQAAVHSSPAALRLQLQNAVHGGLQIQIRKARGGAPGAVVVHPAVAS